MSIKSDRWIKRMAEEHHLIHPFVDTQVHEGVISYGLSSYGFDIRVADRFKVFTNIHFTTVDPKHFTPQSFADFQGDLCIIPPNSFALARTVETFRIPRNILAICLGKSTYGRGASSSMSPPSSPNGKERPRSRSPTAPPFTPGSTPTRASPKSASSKPMRSAEPRMRTSTASTRGRKRSRSRESDHPSTPNQLGQPGESSP